MSTITEHHVRKRNSRVKMAVATSLCSKLVTAGLQVVAFPIAVRSLGAERFGVYAVLASSLGWVYLVGLGLGPGLTLKIAAAVAKEDRAAEKQYFTSALITICALLAVLTPVPILLLSRYPGYLLFGAKYSPYAAEIQMSLYILIGFVVSQLVLSVVDAVQTGYQEQHINNLWTMVGSGLSIIAMIISSLFTPSIIGLIVSVNIGILIGRLCNAINLLGLKRPYLLPRRRDFDFQIGKILLLDGLSFSLLNLGYYFCHQYSQVMVGQTLGPKSLASFAIMIQWYILMNGMVFMVGRPLWPALTDAIARKDYAWAHTAYRKLLLYACTYGVVVGGAIAMIGKPIAYLLYHGHIVPSSSLLCFTGFYFACFMWEYVHTTVLIGLQRLWVPSVTLLARSAIMVLVAPVLMHRMGAEGMMAAICLGILLTSVWFSPLMVKRYFRFPGREAQSSQELQSQE